jgi:hypothetical protein
MNSDDFGGELSELPNQKYIKFFEKFKEIDTLDVHEWKVGHLVGYFKKVYEQYYKCKYQFKFNTPSPVKSFEVFNIKKLGVNLTSDPALLKEYIDWLFENKVPQLKKRFTSISFIAKEENIHDYKMKVLFSNKNKVGNGINRSTQLPSNYLEVFASNGISISTYGDLAFLNQSDPMSDNLSQAFEELSRLGFDRNILATVV